MSLQDPRADMLTRIKNGQARSMRHVSMPSSKQKVAIAKIMQDEGFITIAECFRRAMILTNGALRWFTLPLRHTWLIYWMIQN